MDDDEESRSKKPVRSGLLFDQMSIEELQNHILVLEKEIARARDVIASKETARGDADSVFN